MQTFMPFISYDRVARTLDRQRLGKQRIEAKQILRILLNETNSKGWRNHPAVKMWIGYEQSLARYGVAICMEWRRRGYQDAQLPYFHARMGPQSHITPPWVRSQKFRQSHQSNLVRKDWRHYRKYFHTISNKLPYIWPEPAYEVSH
jgi:hypothetical protein